MGIETEYRIREKGALGFLSKWRGATPEEVDRFVHGKKDCEDRERDPQGGAEKGAISGYRIRDGVLQVREDCASTLERVLLTGINRLWRDATPEEIVRFVDGRGVQRNHESQVYAQDLIRNFYATSKREKKTMKINVKNSTDTIEVGNLAYGTYVTGIISHPGIVYQKIDKRNLGQGISLHIPNGYSLLMNVKLGSLRAVSGSVQVSVYDAELNLSRTTNFGPHLKESF